MKAYEKVDLVPELEKSVAQLWKNIQVGIAAREAQKKYADLVRRLSFFYELRVYCFDTLIIELQVDSIKDAEPAIAMIEDEFKVTFDNASDYASEHLTERDFRAEGLDLKLDVKVRDDSPRCKSVIVGYETVPKYEIRCDDEEQTL